MGGRCTMVPSRGAAVAMHGSVPMFFGLPTRLSTGVGSFACFREIAQLGEMGSQCGSQLRERCLIRAVSSCTWSNVRRRSAISLRIFLSACITVV